MNGMLSFLDLVYGMHMITKIQFILFILSKKSNQPAGNWNLPAGFLSSTRYYSEWAQAG